MYAQESDLIEHVEEDKDSDAVKTSEEEKSKVQVMHCSIPMKQNPKQKPYTGDTVAFIFRLLY